MSSKSEKSKSGKKKPIIITTAVVLAVALIAGGVLYLFFGDGLFSSNNVNTLSEEQINELSNKNFVMLEEGFTDVAVKDEESAIKAVASVADKLGIENAEKELKVSAVNTVDGDTYYRMQQYYNDIPVYGKDVVLASNKKGSVILLTSNSINIEQGLSGKSIDNDFDDKKAISALEDYFDDLYSIEDKGPYYMVLDSNSIEYTHLYTVLAAVNEEAANLEVAVSNNKYKVVFTNDLVNTDDKDYSYKVSDNKYYMFDKKRNIVMLNSKRNLSKILGNDSEKHIFISKPLIIDGFSDEEQIYVFRNYLNNNNDEIINDISGKFSTHVYSPIEYETSKNNTWNKDAVNFMNNVQNTYNFYKDILNRNGYNDKQGEMFVAYNDGFGGGGNAYSSGSFLCFGYKEDSSAEDLVAHEFTHSVEGSISNMAYEGESGALKEAYSDIFGELAESYTNGSCDWIHNKGRNLKDPSKSKESGSTVAYPQKYKDKNWISTINKNKDHGGVHTNCTVISHAAYLMNNGIDGDENMKIGTELLAKIWYKSLQSLHSNATFEQCAATVTSAAKIMYKNGTLTQSQLGCVEEAFAEVGLGTSLIESGSSLVVYDRYQKKCDNYHITIKDTFEDKTVVDTDVSGTDTYTLDLESGTYIITVSDNTKDGSKNIFSKTISVVNSLRKIKSEVSLYTDFGVDFDAMLEKKKDELIDEYGVASTETYKKNLYSYNYAAENIGWTNREGILSAKLVDLDNDKINELLSVRLIRENGDNASSIEITAYKADADGVQSAGTVSVPYGTEIESMEINIYTYNIGKTTYICYESYRYGILVDYQKPQYYVLEYSSGKLSKVMNIYNDYNGSDGIKFTMITEKDGKETSEDLCYSSSNHQPATGKYKDSDSPIGSAMEAFGFSASSKNLLDGGDHYPSYANHKNADLICTLKTQKTAQDDYKNYETQSSAKDYTGLDHSKSTTAPKKTVAWKELYLSQLNENELYNAAALAYINDDDIPELILQSYSVLPGTKMFWVNGDEIKSYDIGGVAGLSYNEKEGTVKFVQMNHGISSTVIYSFDGSAVNLLHKGNDDTGNFGYDSDKVSYYWDDEKVSKSEYEKNLSKFDYDDHGQEFYSFDEMKEIIKNY